MVLVSIACSHMSGLFDAVSLTAGPDGHRKHGSYQCIGLALAPVTVRIQLCLSVATYCHHHVSPSHECLLA